MPLSDLMKYRLIGVPHMGYHNLKNRVVQLFITTNQPVTIYRIIFLNGSIGWWFHSDFIHSTGMLGWWSPELKIYVSRGSTTSRCSCSLLIHQASKATGYVHGTRSGGSTFIFPSFLRHLAAFKLKDLQLNSRSHVQSGVSWVFTCFHRMGLLWGWMCIPGWSWFPKNARVTV